MNAADIAEELRRSSEHGPCLTAFHHLPARPARYADFPAGLRPELRRALEARGIARLYTHQAEAIGQALAGRNVVVVTPTASGKTLCYNLPVLNAILGDPDARALYLFPTKALTQDQAAELSGLVDALGVEIKTSTYDGDTPAAVRRQIRLAGHVVLTNPDMLHTGILPHHTKWVRLFEHLRYVVVDELHHYRGVFGSHLANVLRRLRRICRAYGSDPTFICASATIANPKELAERLVEDRFTLVDQSGAPSGEKFILFYNPPLVNRPLGTRVSSLTVARRLASTLLERDLQTIVFARSRLAVEVLLTYLQRAARELHRPEGAVRGYRGGYLPNERRAIERGLRDGSVRAVVATNALELGVDVGGLEASLLAGYPGSIASTWQQFGRVGRRDAPSLAVFIASAAPLDQFLVTHPEYFFGRSPESALIDPNNLEILLSHVHCAAFEQPFAEGERFGIDATGEVLAHLEAVGTLRHTGGRWFWMAESFPAENVSLRSASVDNFVIIEQRADQRAEVLGELDRPSVPVLLHEEAIYLHGGRQYQVERLDWAEKKAYVRRVDVDYYTDASLAVNLKVLELAGQAPDESPRAAWGDLAVTWLATIFKKVRFHTHENVGWGKIFLPEEELQTRAFWLSLPPDLTAGLGRAEVEGVVVGLGNLLSALAPLHLLCDPKDLGVQPEVRSPFTGEPTIFIWERTPGGVGFSERLFALRRTLLDLAYETVRACPCASGCPSCVGPPAEVGPAGKAATLALLRRVCAGGA